MIAEPKTLIETWENSYKNIPEIRVKRQRGLGKIKNKKQRKDRG